MEQGGLYPTTDGGLGAEDVEAPSNSTPTAIAISGITSQNHPTRGTCIAVSATCSSDADSQQRADRLVASRPALSGPRVAHGHGRTPCLRGGATTLADGMWSDRRGEQPRSTPVAIGGLDRSRREPGRDPPIGVLRTPA